MHYASVTGMQGGYFDSGGFQNGLYGSLNYDGASIKLHHTHYPESAENCYNGYSSQNTGSMNYANRDPPAYSDSAVFQNGFMPSSNASYYKMSGRGVDTTEYGFPRESMLLKTDVAETSLTDSILSQRFQNDGTVSDMANISPDTQVHTEDNQNLKMEDISEFKTDLSLQEAIPADTPTDCIPTIEVKDQESSSKSDTSAEAETVNAEEDKARGNSDVKPALSYIALIAKAILESSQKRLSLGSIYSWIEKNYPYYVNKGQGWRNSVRHNLSLNDCFVKAGRCEDGKGNYWAIHPTNVQDFLRGDFRQRRRSRRRGRKKDCDLNGMYHMTNGYLGASAPLPPTVPFTPTQALSSIYSPYTEAERRAYRLDDALLRQNMNNPFMKWYHGNSGYGNQTTACNTGMYGNSSPQWQTGYTEQTTQGVYPLNAFSPRNYTAPALV